MNLSKSRGYLIPKESNCTHEPAAALATVAPTVTTAGPLTSQAAVKTNFVLAATGTNTRDCQMTWSITSGPTWATINAGTGVVSVTPPIDQAAGNVALTVKATNCAGSGSATIQIAVTAPASIYAVYTGNVGAENKMSYVAADITPLKKTSVVAVKTAYPYDNVPPTYRVWVIPDSQAGSTVFKFNDVNGTAGNPQITPVGFTKWQTGLTVNSVACTIYRSSTLLGGAMNLVVS